MKSMSIHLNPEANLDLVWIELENMGAYILYSDEDEGQKIIYAKIKDESLLENHPAIARISPFTLPAIDWESQFQEHGMNYHDGYVHVDLKDFGCLNPIYNPIKIQPGPGFGDLSHPTTRLVLKLMSDRVNGKDILDIGCGSGVLSFAAISMGAKSCFGVDIDDEAIEHSNLNLDVNGLQGLIQFGQNAEYLPKDDQKDVLILMNMIQSEQVQAWESLKVIHHIPGDCLISGILKQDVDLYLAFAKSNNWTLNSMIEEDGWLGLHLTRN